MTAIFRFTYHLVWFNDFKQLRYAVIALTISDQEMNRTDNKRTTERDRGDLQQPAVNRNRHTTPMQRNCAAGGQTCNP